MPQRIPPWVEHADVLDDAARYSAMTPEQRLAVFVDVCELAETILAGRPDRAEVLEAHEPMAPRAEAIWQRLVAESRRAR
jgi:hypothetical protein